MATAEGANYPSPQALLDGLLGALAFDPLAFSRLPARNQYEQISSMVGLDFTNDDGLNRADFDERTEANREAKAKRAAADAITVPADTPDEPVSVDAIVTRIRDAEAGNRELESERGRREGARLNMDSRSLSAENLIKRAEEEVCRALEQATDLLRRAEAVRVEAGARADRLRLQAAEATSQADEAAAKLAALPPLDAGTDTAAMQEQITAAEVTNASRQGEAPQDRAAGGVVRGRQPGRRAHRPHGRNGARRTGPPSRPRTCPSMGSAWPTAR